MNSDNSGLLLDIYTGKVQETVEDLYTLCISYLGAYQ